MRVHRHRLRRTLRPSRRRTRSPANRPRRPDPNAVEFLHHGGERQRTAISIPPRSVAMRRSTDDGRRELPEKKLHAAQLHQVDSRGWRSRLRQSCSSIRRAEATTGSIEIAESHRRVTRVRGCLRLLGKSSSMLRFASWVNSPLLRRSMTASGTMSAHRRAHQSARHAVVRLNLARNAHEELHEIAIEVRKRDLEAVHGGDPTVPLQALHVIAAAALLIDRPRVTGTASTRGRRAASNRSRRTFRNRFVNQVARHAPSRGGGRVAPREGRTRGKVTRRQVPCESSHASRRPRLPTRVECCLSCAHCANGTNRRGSRNRRALDRPSARSADARLPPRAPAGTSPDAGTSAPRRAATPHATLRRAANSHEPGPLRDPLDGGVGRIARWRERTPLRPTVCRARLRN